MATKRKGAGWPIGVAVKRVGLGLSLFGLNACNAVGPQSTLDAQGPVARMQLDVFMLTVYVCAGIFLVTSGFLVYALWRFRARPGQTEARLKHLHGNIQLERSLMVVASLLLILIAVSNVRVLFATSKPPADEPTLRIEVTGNQWWWKFSYPDLDIVTANELHIPAGQAIEADLISADVIHSFWVPKLAGKMDLIPNKRNHIWFKADKPGVYFGQCAEFCGVSHANMRFRVIAHDPADFETWVQAHRKPAQMPEAPLAIEGEKLFQQKGCTTCHAIHGTSAQGNVGPNLTLLGNRRTLAAGLLANTPDTLVRWLRNPQAVKPGSLMPNLGLNDAEAKAIATYLGSLK